MELKDKELVLLWEIKLRNSVPVVRFELRSSVERELVSVALSNVLLTTQEDTMETVKETGAMLQALEDQGLIRIDYHLAVTVKSDYDNFGESSLYQYFCKTVEESRSNPKFLFDTPYLKRGRVTLTAKGERILKAQG